MESYKYAICIQGGRYYDGDPDSIGSTELEKAVLYNNEEEANQNTYEGDTVVKVIQRLELVK